MTVVASDYSPLTSSGWCLSESAACVHALHGVLPEWPLRQLPVPPPARDTQQTHGRDAGGAEQPHLPTHRGDKGALTSAR